NIDLGASKTGKDEGLLREQQMRAIEFGSDMHREIEVPHRLERHFRIGHGNRKIAAETDQSLRTAVPDRLDSLERIVALVARRFESEHAGQSIQKLVIRNLGDANRAVSLHIGVAAPRRNAGA